MRFWRAAIMASLDALDACSRGGILTCALGTCWERSWRIRILISWFAYSQAVEICAVSATVLKLTARCCLRRRAMASSARRLVISAFCCAALRSPSMLRTLWFTCCVMAHFLQYGDQGCKASYQLFALFSHAGVTSCLKQWHLRFFLTQPSLQHRHCSLVNGRSTEVEQFFCHLQGFQTEVVFHELVQLGYPRFCHCASSKAVIFALRSTIVRSRCLAASKIPASFASSQPTSASARSVCSWVRTSSTPSCPSASSSSRLLIRTARLV